MIGVIGPRDSVATVLRVAEEEGRLADVIGRSYDQPEDATKIAIELQEMCPVLLFTGRVPFALANGDAQVHADTQFIDHSRADLYRVMAQILIDRHGMMPRLSVDTISEATLQSAFRDIDLPVPTRTLPVADDEDHLQFSNGEQVATFHLEAIKDHDVEACLTCFANTFEALKRAHVPVWRVEHSRGTIQQALRNAWLTDELHRSHSSQLAVALVRMDTTLRGLDPYQREAARLRVHQGLLEHAKKLSGQLTTVDDLTFAITTSRGAVENAISRLRAGYASLLTPPDLGLTLITGFGIATTYAIAEESARHALGLSELQGRTCVVFPDGSIYTAEESESPVKLQLQETTPAILELSEKLGIGPLSIRRLVGALGRVDHTALTAQQLAHAYGVQQRSARRLLNALCAADLGEAVGVRAGPGKGRPQTVYSAHIADLMKIIGGVEPSAAPAAGDK